MGVLSKNKEIIITKFILSGGDISSREIQESCNLSRKTLAIEIQQIDSFLKKYGARIESMKGKGYSIVVFDEQKYKEFREEFLYHNQRNRYLYIEKNYLAYLILFELVLNHDYISIEELSDKYHYSRSTVSKSIKTVKGILNKFNCNLVSRPNYGLKIEASEWSKRICLLFSDKIAIRMGTINPDFENVFKQTFDKEKYNYTAFELIVDNILRKHQISVPYGNSIKVYLYIILSQTRADYYHLIHFEEKQLERIENSRFLAASREIAEEFTGRNIYIQEKDISALAILLASYATIENKNKVEPLQYASCKEDTEELLKCLYELYDGVENSFDEVFIEEFSCYLAGLKERLLFCMPSDDEGVYVVKQDGSFLLDLCREFAIFYSQKYHVRLSEAELLNAYYIFSSSFLRNNKNTAQYEVAIVSRYGIHYARNIAQRILLQYGNHIAKIDAFEFTDIDGIDLNYYHFVITDIEQKRFNFTPIPLIKLDFFREPKESRAITTYLSIMTSANLSEFISDSNLIKDKRFKCKTDVYTYIAQNYIEYPLAQEFIDDCVQNNSFISNERCNRIALISTSSKYYSKQQIVVIFNKTPIVWDNELVQIFVLFNRKSQKYLGRKTLNSILTCFLHSNVNIAQELSQMDAEAMIDFIVRHIYRNLS